MTFFRLGVRLFLALIPLAILVRPALAGVASDPHLYRLKKNGVTSYVFGTLHMGVTLSDLPPSVLESLATVHTVWGEQTLDFYRQSLQTRKAYRQAFLRRASTDCRSRLDMTDPNHQRTRKLIDAGVPGEYAGCEGGSVVNRLVVAFAPYIFAESPKGALDAEVVVELARRGAQVRALETDKERTKAYQIQEERFLETARWAGRSSSGDEPPLAESYEDIALLQAQAHEQVRFYLSGSDDLTYNYDDSDHAVLLRNRNWVRKIADRPSESFALVVGYRHLYGTGGLLELLRRRGYSVTRVPSGRTPKVYDEFAHIAASRDEIRSARCLRFYSIDEMRLADYFAKVRRESPVAAAAVGGLLFKDQPLLMTSAYRLLTSHWNYQLKPVLDVDMWPIFKDDPCPTPECAVRRVFGADGEFYLAFLMKTAINLSHLGYDRMSPPVFAGETVPNERTVRQFRALYTPVPWTRAELQPYLQGALNLPAHIFPLPYTRLLRTRYNHWDGPGIHANALITIFPVMEDFDPYYKMYSTVHEIGHQVGNLTHIDKKEDWINLSWEWVDGEKRRVRPRSQDLFVSLRATADPLEDFAESFAAYRFNPEKLKRVSLAKYRFLKERVFKGVEYDGASACPVSVGDELMKGD